MASNRVAAALLLLLAAPIGRAVAQRPIVPVTDPAFDDLRLLELVPDTAPLWATWIRPPRTFAGPGAASLSLFDPTLRVFANTAYPWGQNDGAVWQGKGLTAALDLGAALTWGRLSLTLRPTLIYEGNASFALPAYPADTVPTGYSRWASPWHKSGARLMIDQPIRFGPAAYWSLDPGQSGASLALGGIALGAGTENLWWGPARFNPIVMSGNAAGFPHAWIGTRRPLSVGIGQVDFQWIWGRLSGSKYYSLADSAPSRIGRRYLTGLVGTFRPKPLPGLSLGATRVYYEQYPPGGLRLRDYFLVFNGITKSTLASSTDPFGNDRRDELLSLFARWVLPASGFEAYGEWARNDHNWDLRDLLLEPEHSQAYTLGFQQARAVGDSGSGRLLRVYGELTHLERDATQIVRPTPPYYVHHVVTAGYTQDGQVIGAGIGPGGDAQTLGAEWLGPRHRWGVRVLRQVHDNDAFYDLRGRTASDTVNGVAILAFKFHDVSFGAAANAAVFAGDWTLAGELVWTKEFNRYYEYRNDRSNLNVALTLRRRV